MLVLGRKSGQQIWVTGPALITLDIRGGNHVRVGISAEDSTRVFRVELLDHDDRKKFGLPTDERQDA